MEPVKVRMLVATKIAKNLFFKINLLTYQICNCDQCNDCSECFPQRLRSEKAEKVGKKSGSDSDVGIALKDARCRIILSVDCDCRKDFAL